ncbi:MAG: hypothetical protein WAM66_02720, partial [Acidobacteriaceae bacterium]
SCCFKIPMICSSVYRLFFILRPPVQITRELQLNLVEFSGGRSRVIVAGLELLGKLPRSLWSKRSSTVLDEANLGLLERASEQASTLQQHQTELESEFDLELLPAAGELRAFGIALRANNLLTGLFSSTCRKARRVYRGVARDNRKRRRSEIADGLLRCAQYLADVETLTGNSALVSICGSHFSGTETPFADLVEVARWASVVRQRLATFGEMGLEVRESLFCGTPDQLDRLAALREHPALTSLTTVLGKITEHDTMEWNDLVRRERTRAERLIAAADIFERAAFCDSCSQADINDSADALESIERLSSAICEDGNALGLVGGSLDALRQNLGSLNTTLRYADTVASWTLPKAFIDYLFANPEHVAELQSTARDLFTRCAAVDARGKEANTMAQLDAPLWCGTESFATAHTQALHSIHPP